MSKEDVALFIKAVNKKADLASQVARAPRATEWVSIAKDAGFNFSADELASVISTVTRKQVSPSDCVQEYLVANNAMARGELSQKALEAVTGGAARVTARPHTIINHNEKLVGRSDKQPREASPEGARDREQG